MSFFFQHVPVSEKVPLSGVETRAAGVNGHIPIFVALICLNASGPRIRSGWGYERWFQVRAHQKDKKNLSKYEF